jgi:hypothetical protein
MASLHKKEIEVNTMHTMATSKNVFTGKLLDSGSTKLWNPTTKVVLLWVAVLICCIAARSFLVK